MLRLERVHYCVKIAGREMPIFAGVSGAIAEGHYALLVEDPNHRKHVVDLLCGTRVPGRGQVQRKGRTSWAIGRASFLKGRLKATDIVGLICRTYDLDQTRTEGFLSEILTYPSLLDRRIVDWPGEARSELELALALCPDFSVYVTDGNLHRSRGRFGPTWLELFRERTAGRGLIVAGLNVASMLHFCNAAFVVRYGTVELHEHLESALRQFPPRPPDLAIGASERDLADESDAL